MPAHFFDEVGFPAHVAAPARHFDRQGVALSGPHAEAQTQEDRFGLRLRHRDPQDELEAGGPEGQGAAPPRSGHAVDEPGPRGARADLLEQMGDTGEGHHRRLGIGPPLEAVRGLGVHSEGLGRATDRERVPVSGFEGHHLRVAGNLAPPPPHDSRQGQSALRPRHHPLAGRETATDSVEGLERLSLPRPAHPQPSLRDERLVEGMRGVPHLHHDVVREVHHVVDGPPPHGLEAVAHPGGRRPQAHVEHAGREART